MNERNTNRRAQTPGNRTTQRHQIDGRPAPRRQASHASEYSEGSFAQPPQNAFRTEPRQSTQSPRSRQQQNRRQQPQQRSRQRASS